MMFFQYALFLMMLLRWPHNNLSGLEDDESQQLVMVQVNSFSENSFYIKDEKGPSSFKTISSIVQNWTELKDE